MSDVKEQNRILHEYHQKLFNDLKTNASIEKAHIIERDLNEKLFQMTVKDYINILDDDNLKNGLTPEYFYRLPSLVRAYLLGTPEKTFGEILKLIDTEYTQFGPALPDISKFNMRLQNIKKNEVNIIDDTKNRSVSFNNFIDSPAIKEFKESGNSLNMKSVAYKIIKYVKDKHKNKNNTKEAYELAGQSVIDSIELAAKKYTRILNNKNAEPFYIEKARQNLYIQLQFACMKASAQILSAPNIGYSAETFVLATLYQKARDYAEGSFLSEWYKGLFSSGANQLSFIGHKKGKLTDPKKDLSGYFSMTIKTSSSLRPEMVEKSTSHNVKYTLPYHFAGKENIIKYLYFLKNKLGERRTIIKTLYQRNESNRALLYNILVAGLSSDQGAAYYGVEGNIKEYDGAKYIVLIDRNPSHQHAYVFPAGLLLEKFLNEASEEGYSAIHKELNSISGGTTPAKKSFLSQKGDILKNMKMSGTLYFHFQKLSKAITP